MYPEMLTDIFGQTNDTINFNFKTKPRNSFGNLKLILDPNLSIHFGYNCWTIMTKFWKNIILIIQNLCSIIYYLNNIILKSWSMKIAMVIGTTEISSVKPKVKNLISIHRWSMYVRFGR